MCYVDFGCKTSAGIFFRGKGGEWRGLHYCELYNESYKRFFLKWNVE